MGAESCEMAVLEAIVNYTVAVKVAASISSVWLWIIWPAEEQLESNKPAFTLFFGRAGESFKPASQ